jgi:hypothetical protein
MSNSLEYYWSTILIYLSKTTQKEEFWVVSWLLDLFPGAWETNWYWQSKPLFLSRVASNVAAKTFAPISSIAGMVGKKALQINKF